MVDEYWLALVAERDVSSPLAREFERTARACMDVLVDGNGYRRGQVYDLSVPVGSDRYRTMVLRGTGLGVDPRLFLQGHSGLVRVGDLGYRLELRASEEGGLLVWQYALEPGVACAEYERRKREGSYALLRSLENDATVQEAVDAACVRRGLPAAFVRVGLALYTREFVIDRRCDGPWPVGATKPYSSTAWHG